MARALPVWDPLVRIGHWALAVTVAAAWLTHEGGGKWHEWLGYASLALVAARIATIVAADVSGWLYTTDRFWGVAWVEKLHETISDVLLGLIALHVAGVVIASRRHSENLVAAMIHGRKRPPAEGDVD